MAEMLDLNEKRGSEQAHLEVATKRLTNAQEELDAARAAGKPQAQLDSLQRVVDERKSDLDSLNDQLGRKSHAQAA